MSVAAILVLLVGQSAGVQIKEIAPGKGVKAKIGDIVTVSFRGKLKSGKVFDSTEGKAPFAFRLSADSEVFDGWHKGVSGMRVGGKRHLIIPPSLAYGSTAQSKVPANSTLLIDVELLRIDDRDAKPKVQVKDIKGGSGRAVKMGDRVSIHYRGTFLNGVPFDSSYDKHMPYNINLGMGEVIPGLEQGLMGIRVGGKRRITIPYELAYGKNGRAPGIPRMQTLIFDVEMVKFRS